MRRLNRLLLLAILLIILSAVIYILQIRIFHQNRDTFFYLLQDLAFLPIQILVVTLILNELLAIREKRAMMTKMNMAIGVFFSEVGRELMHRFIAFTDGKQPLSELVIVQKDWPTQTFTHNARQLAKMKLSLDPRRGDLAALKIFLTEKRSFLLVLLENPSLLEHESFTNLLWAVFHLAEELGFRPHLDPLSDPDAKHLAGDIERAHNLLLSEWLFYMRHLQTSYPYIFSLMIRTNPFDSTARVELQ